MRIDVGAGPVRRDGWVSVDSDPAWGTEVVADPRFGLPWTDGVADGAVSHHVLQMVAYLDLVPWLAEVRRVLAPGAWLRMTLPDLLGAAVASIEEDRAWFPIASEMEPTVDGALCLYLSQAGATRSVFTGPWAVDLCERAGYRQAVWRNHGAKAYTLGPAWLTELDSRLDESIVVEAQA